MRWWPEIGWTALAVVLHLLLLLVLPAVQERTALAASSDPVGFDVIEAGTGDEPTEPDPEPEPIAPPQPIARARTTPPPAAQPQAPAPVTFDDVMTNEGGGSSGWSVAVRDNKDRDTDAPPTSSLGGPRGSGTGAVTDVGNLSRKPRPPNLRRILERNYPKRARAENKEGEAVVRLQINPDGQPSSIRVLTEEPKGFGFGEACSKTLRGQRWPGAPVNAKGERVATRVNYTCRFRIRD